jgi:hypothetical protein
VRKYKRVLVAALSLWFVVIIISSRRRRRPAAGPVWVDF